MLMRYMCGSNLTETTQVRYEFPAQCTESTIGDPIRLICCSVGRKYIYVATDKGVVSGCFCHKSLWHHVYDVTMMMSFLCSLVILSGRIFKRPAIYKMIKDLLLQNSNTALTKHSSQLTPSVCLYVRAPP